MYGKESRMFARRLPSSVPHRFVSRRVSQPLLRVFHGGDCSPEGCWESCYHNLSCLVGGITMMKDHLMRDESDKAWLTPVEDVTVGSSIPTVLIGSEASGMVRVTAVK